MIRRTEIVSRASVIILAAMILVSCGSKSVKYGDLIITESPLNTVSYDNPGGSGWRFLEGARIVAVETGKPGSAEILTEDFHSACFPEISYDGKFMIFAGQKEENETWQIWEMNLKNLKARQVTSATENCIDPDYLPGGRCVFSKLTVNDTVISAHCLYTCNIDGSDVRQISFSPTDNFSTTVLKDGRLLTVNNQLHPEKGDPMLMVMRPDGTKADMFYKSNMNDHLLSNPRESDDGRILFIESPREGGIAGRMVSITYNRPLHTRIDLNPETGGEFISVLPLQPDKYLVSCRQSDTGEFVLFEFDPVKKLTGDIVYSSKGYNVVDAVLAEAYERPKKLPSEVDLLVKTGLLLCQDVNFTGFVSRTDFSGAAKADRIMILGVDSVYGVVPVETDGSFQLKVIADKPFRIQALDEHGQIVNGPCSWIWLRPNERRGCVGCHEDPELAPLNRVPLAVKKQPVIVPVHISDIKEKIVELE